MKKLLHGDVPIDPRTNAKRNNFQNNFLGDDSSATMDEQMSGLMIPGSADPANYGHAERLVGELGQEIGGVSPRGVQDVTWAGAKKMREGDKYGGSKPMIKEVNESIERTSRIYGLTPKEVVVQGIIHSRIPMLGIGGAAVLVSQTGMMQQEEQY